MGREGRTIAVLGSGLDRLNPEENRALAAEITERGAIISELPLGTAPGGLERPSGRGLAPWGCEPSFRLG